MKKIFSIVLTGICIVSATSCKKYLDINTNPNQPTTATPALVFPQALTATASLISNSGDYNEYGSRLNGYFGNAGGFGSLGNLISYNFTTGDFNGLFQNTYDNLEDYQYIIDNTDPSSIENATANIMRAYDFQMLVDTYNKVPYLDALKGSSVLQPTYTDGEVIYKDLGDKLDAAIATLNAGTTSGVFGTSDVLFKGDLSLWKKFANTLKLRLIIRAGSKVAFTKPTPDATVGFLTTDALVNPGYTKTVGKQNPMWDKWAFSETGAVRGAANVYLASPWILSFFNGTKIDDPARGKVIFFGYNGASTLSNQLGNTSASASKAPTPAFFYTLRDVGTTVQGSGSTGKGILKGETAGQPLMLAAESYLLQSEAAVRGIISGADAKALFNNGIKASFNYLYKDASGTVVGDANGDYATYLSNNSTNRLVNFDLAGTNEQKVEAIINQKYIALAYLFGAEAWNEFRRTGYPAITGNTPTTTFASTVSVSTAPNKLPTRILYPVSEYSYNSANTPSGINPFSDKIFWAK
ncbi:SusD/RagB family nutrient-binding outer membrane lipoprotein [Mucilaginibacter terrenus]|uniref:SusD/RagB family nutrient-binding outer membrane lipoprotein n=1 Tax=Mucilaginibacter terrenus TaxID=2482727 RepID=A0A3E2NPI3_9SPHI|nr:SusD/RagB family nutrient-binding outer membrane lipoprotein [Mucilaginibacter terrenus]RFZ82894.1 SusD/RagB family nutrient-binding outer membrane lipoprotein [Mucilaginibacter terrenus]